MVENQSNKLSHELTLIERDAGELFDKLTTEHKEFNFLQDIWDGDEVATDKEILQNLKVNWELDVLPLLEYRNSTTGTVTDVYITSVVDGWIQIINTDGDGDKAIKFSELGGIHERLCLLNEMLDLLK